MNYLEDAPNLIDPVRPGEQWFFYWKTSAALWENRILQFPAHQVIFIPLNWGFHSESAIAWDFGKYHPERDLGRLVKLLVQHNRRFCWILPLTPAPFLTNGGVPSSAAKTLSLSRDGVHLAVLDQENKLNKMYSFYTPKVFQMYAHFLEELAALFKEIQMKAPIWGGSFYYFENNLPYSYLEDSSLAFEQGFSRYLKQNSPSGVDLTKTSDEVNLKTKFTQEVSELFKNTAQEAFKSFWHGTQEIMMIGGSPKETIERTLESGKSQLDFFSDLFNHLVNNRWISTSLLNKSEKKEVLASLLLSHFGAKEIEYRYQYQVQSAELSEEFRPFGLVHIFDRVPSVFNQNGLVQYLDQKLKWMYSFSNEIDFTTEWIESHHNEVKFFSGKELDRTRFSQMLKFFMMGQRVVLDKTQLSPELEKKLQLFYQENNLNVQMINYVTMINICELGDGRLITIDGEKLVLSNEQDKFWDHLFNYFNLTQPQIISDDDVFSLWRIRATTAHELNYLDVRRVNLYNPTSYKKKVTVHTQKHFAFMKMIDPVHAHAKSTTEGVEVDLAPNGRVVLDFGHYEEG